MRGLSAEQREQLRGLLMVMIAERPRAGDTEIPAPEDEAHQETGTDAR
ncbi:MAG: hypothetical protein HGA44_14365 [Cellulomonadaceae bacterium]|nr:hypothetical protein [Cellulomonadaceae bacterium]